MTNLDNMLKSRDITLPAKVHLVKAMDFQWSRVDVRVGTIKQAERRIAASELRCWRRLLRDPWSAKISN